MRISSQSPELRDVTVPAPSATASTLTTGRTSPVSPSDVTAEASALKSAMEALRAMPDIDKVRVADVKDALARGDLPLNVSKLATLIQQYHRKSIARDT